MVKHQCDENRLPVIQWFFFVGKIKKPDTTAGLYHGLYHQIHWGYPLVN